MDKYHEGALTFLHIGHKHICNVYMNVVLFSLENLFSQIILHVHVLAIMT